MGAGAVLRACPVHSRSGCVSPSVGSNKPPIRRFKELHLPRARMFGCGECGRRRVTGNLWYFERSAMDRDSHFSRLPPISIRSEQDVVRSENARPAERRVFFHPTVSTSPAVPTKLRTTLSLAQRGAIRVAPGRFSCHAGPGARRWASSARHQLGMHVAHISHYIYALVPCAPVAYD